MYKNQDTRGKNGFGFIEIEGSTVGPLRRFQYEKETLTALYPTTAKEILFHHRIPTSTPNIPESNHPIPVQHESLQYDYYVIHNGVISNLREKYEKMGFVFTTTIKMAYVTAKGMNYEALDEDEQTNDSEYFAIDLALAIEGEKEALDSEGSIAFIALQMEKGSQKAVKLFYGHNYRSPLKMDITDYAMSLSSAGTGSNVTEHRLHSIDYATGLIEDVRALEIGTLYKPQPANSTPVHHHGQARIWSSKYGKYLDNVDLDEFGYSAYDQEYWERKYASETGMSDTKQLTIKNTEAPDPDDEENLGIFPEGTPIKGYEDTGIFCTLSTGTHVYLTMDELEFDYVRLNDSLAYWEEYIKKNANEPNAVAEAEDLLKTLRADLHVFDIDLPNYYPEAFSIDLIETAEPLI